MKSILIMPKRLSGDINIPPSKSLCHRAIICAGLASGKSMLENIEYSDDIAATISAMRSFGIEIDEVKLSNNRGNLIVRGHRLDKTKNNKIDCNESGSTIRFLIPIAGLVNETIRFTGRGKLTERPLDIYYKIFDKQCLEYKNNDGKLPLDIKGRLQPGMYELRGDVSSQFITGLLFALPLLDEDSKIIITTELESKGYVDLTLVMLKKYGIDIINNGYKEFYIKGNQNYKAVDYNVEGDFSQAAFWIVAGILGGDIGCKPLDINTLQGDKAILDIVQKMGADIEVEDSVIRVKQKKTTGITIDVSQCPDLVPILAVLGALSNGTTKIINASRLRIKESDRLKAISTELTKLGADIKELEDELIINGKDRLKGGTVEGWNDHRIVMALAIASIRCDNSVIINGSKAVNKSYPMFFNDFRMLGGIIHECDMG